MTKFPLSCGIHARKASFVFSKVDFKHRNQGKMSEPGKTNWKANTRDLGRLGFFSIFDKKSQYCSSLFWGTWTSIIAVSKSKHSRQNSSHNCHFEEILRKITTEENISIRKTDRCPLFFVCERRGLNNPQELYRHYVLTIKLQLINHNKLTGTLCTNKCYYCCQRKDAAWEQQWGKMMIYHYFWEKI